jgi:hypothetical protein
LERGFYFCAMRVATHAPSRECTLILSAARESVK